MIWMEKDTDKAPTSITLQHFLNQNINRAIILGQKLKKTPIIELSEDEYEVKTKQNRTKIIDNTKTTKKRRKR